MQELTGSSRKQRHQHARQLSNSRTLEPVSVSEVSKKCQSRRQTRCVLIGPAWLPAAVPVVQCGAAAVAHGFHRLLGTATRRLRRLLPQLVTRIFVTESESTPTATGAWLVAFRLTVKPSQGWPPPLAAPTRLAAAGAPSATLRAARTPTYPIQRTTLCCRRCAAARIA